MHKRDFLKASVILGLGAALSPKAYSLPARQQIRAIGANNRIRIGIIGCGERGRNALMEGIYPYMGTMNFEIVALSDPWRVARELANSKVKEWFGREARQFTSHRELLAMDNLDAVMIASPDHHHTAHLEAAARAKKHIYVEKPLATDMAGLVSAVNAVTAAGTVVQVGTQLRSLPGMVGARALYQSGALGRLSKAEECRNLEKPYWYAYLNRQIKPEDMDWKEFLGDRPMRPFNAKMCAGWLGYYEFSQGPIAQFAPHFIDLVHFISGAKFPASCVCSGDTFTWKDENKFTTPDCVQATWLYPEGFMVSSSNNFGNGSGSVRKFYGDKGVLKLDNPNAPVYSAEGAPHRDGSIRGQNAVALPEGPDHFLNWLQCMRTGDTPHAPIEAGYQHAVAVLMAARSYETGRKVIYDHQSRQIRFA